MGMQCKIHGRKGAAKQTNQPKRTNQTNNKGGNKEPKSTNLCQKCPNQTSVVNHPARQVKRTKKHTSTRKMQRQAGSVVVVRSVVGRYHHHQTPLSKLNQLPHNHQPVHLPPPQTKQKRNKPILSCQIKPTVLMKMHGENAVNYKARGHQTTAGTRHTYK